MWQADSLVHPVRGGREPGDDLVVIDRDERTQNNEDEANHIVPCSAAIAMSTSVAGKVRGEEGDAHNHSLLNQNLQLSIDLQSNNPSLVNSFASLGVGLGVLPPPFLKSPTGLPPIIPFFAYPPGAAPTFSVDDE